PPSVGYGDCPDKDAAGEELFGWVRDPVTNTCIESDGFHWFDGKVDVGDSIGAASVGPLEPGYYTVTLDALSSGQVVGTATSGGPVAGDPPGVGEFEAIIGGENAAMINDATLVISNR